MRIFGIQSLGPWITVVRTEGIYSPGLDKFLQTLWIYTSIIEPQLVGNSLAHLLRVVPVRISATESTMSAIYNNPVMLTVVQSNLSKIDITITSSLGEQPVDFWDNEVIIGLVFRKV